MKLFIRTEANTTTAMGHMMRCLTIAEAAKKMGIQPIFVVAESGSQKIASDRGFDTICLDRKWDDFDGEIPVISEIIKKENIECMLIDSYWITAKYMDAVSRLTKTAYIDDLHETIWSCEAIINYAVYSDLFDYEKEYPGKQLLLGCDYFPLRKEYAGLEKRKISDVVKNVLVVSGGSDELHFMRTLTENIVADSKYEDIHFKFILGQFNQDYDDISLKAEKTGNISIFKALPSLKEAMLESDIVISAGGTTLYEMAACTLPGIVYILADNQRYNAEGFGRKGLAVYAGDIRTSGTYQNIFKELDMLIENKEKRQQLSDSLYKLVDGEGASRIVKRLFNVEG